LLLGELTAQAPRLALVGLAKNTGKTVALAALLREARAARRVVGVTSVGRDGEERDVIDARIEKPAIDLAAGSLVATTDRLLRASGLPREVLDHTGRRTPLGEVLIARLQGPGAVEVAGPSTSDGVRAVSDAMLSYGADQALIDGAIDRRAASSPEVADGLVISTGAVLGEQLDEVVRLTRDAVELVRMPALEPDSELGALVAQSAPGELLIDADGTTTVLPPRFVLTAGASELGELLGDHAAARALVIAGALPEAFLAELATLTRRARSTITLVVGDASRVFLTEHGIEHYRKQGVHLCALRPICLLALTVNPVAPQSHAFDSSELRRRLAEEIEGVPILDVMDGSYLRSEAAAAAS
jgi:hypothetical protein